MRNAQAIADNALYNSHYIIHAMEYMLFYYMTIILDKITTKQGDLGCTLAFLSAKQQKNHEEVVVFGEIDELNAVLGMALHISANEIQAVHRDMIIHIQHRLFDIGATLYTQQNRLNTQDIHEFDKMIGELTAILPPLQSFVIPSDKTATWHLARAVCRRVERAIWGLYFADKSTENPDAKESLQLIGQYFNRLSDLLFCIARMYDEKTTLWNKASV